MATRSVLASGPGGKDIVMVATREELSTPSKVTLPEPEPTPGLIMPDGSINWGCPCLGGMATGPCGLQFRDAFSCFHYSDAEPKGSDCYEKFSVMQECMSQYPELYGREEDEELSNAISESAAEDSSRIGKAVSVAGAQEVRGAGDGPAEVKKTK
ncbi:mitochondrial intermembrane space import and assembly protein 40-B [Hyposmocoma kahamanoa]|uniref:mitochondrial intermembrane space import and assembly protein 40-B n=1 Tax=Hyposmocoma kahamanoa TaxID=1477025 RepID=UPI000E6D7EE7|nr:mitochondrial intermembrane space import and assembly protein 40-B [Hyposmocoma kahamanoa]